MVIIMEQYLNLIQEKHILSPQNIEHLELCTFKKGEYILHQGDKLEYVYILVKGKVKTCRNTLNGLSFLTSITYPLNIFGEVELLHNELVSNDIIAIEDSVFLRISNLLYHDELIHDQAFIQYIASSLAFKLYKINQNISVSINYPVENRLASYLVSCEVNHIVEDNFVSVAQMIGCSYRQLQRTLGIFVEKGYIEKIHRGTIQIINDEALKQLGQDLYIL